MKHDFAFRFAQRALSLFQFDDFEQRKSRAGAVVANVLSLLRVFVWVEFGIQWREGDKGGGGY